MEDFAEDPGRRSDRLLIQDPGCSRSGVEGPRRYPPLACLRLSLAPRA
jgi:hypothetical protein